MKKVVIVILVLFVAGGIYFGVNRWMDARMQFVSVDGEAPTENVALAETRDDEDRAKDREETAVEETAVEEPAAEEPEPAASENTEETEPMTQEPGGIGPEFATLTAPDTFKVKFETTQGDVVAEFYREWAPQGVDRVYNLVKQNYFTDMRLFRVVPDFVVQFGIHGDPEVMAKWMNAKLMDDPVKQTNAPGTLTFAKTGAPNSRGTQLFINFGNNAFLDSQGFAPIGKVVEGMDVAKQFYSEYRDQPTNLQGQMFVAGNPFIDERFPELDSITKASVIED